MRKLSVLQYSREIGKSTVTIYKKIELGEIKAETIDGKIWVIAEDIKPKDEDSQFIIKRLKVENDLLKEIITSKDSEIATLKYSFDMLSRILNSQIEPRKEAEIVEVKEADISTPRKKKKKKKR